MFWFSNSFPSRFAGRFPNPLPLRGHLDAHQPFFQFGFNLAKKYFSVCII